MGKNFKIGKLPKGVAIAITAIFTMAITACSSDSGQQASQPTETPAPESTTGAAPSTTDPTAQQPGQAPGQATGQTPGQTFTNPVVAGKQPGGMPLPVGVAPNLIQPTNPTERAVVVDKGRPDPFGQIVTPQFVTPPGANQSGVNVANANPNGNVSNRPRVVVPPVAVLPNVSTPARISRPNIASRGNSQNNRIQRSQVASARLPRVPAIRPVVPRVMPPVVPDPNLTAVLPPTPQPEMARAVVVSGVVMVGQEAQAIIKVPNEPTSRYVQAGDRLANGVSVKRIEMNSGSDPIVILEQYGIEVAKMVGEGGAATTAAADSSIPTPPNVPTGAS